MADDLLASIGRELHLQRESLARLAAHLDALPSIAGARRTAEGGTGSRQVDIRRGPAQWDFWLELIASELPRDPVAVFPTFEQLVSLVVDDLGLERSAALGELGLRSRVLTGAHNLVDSSTREAIATFALTGLEVRTVATVPGWFYADEKLAVVPSEWGGGIPAYLIVTHDVPVVAALRAYFDDLWVRAQTAPGVAADWDAVLALLSQGLSDGAIALALGLSLRTVRRRIAGASAAYGAASRFALGVEWERARQN